MASVEQLAEALRILAEQQHGLQTLIASMAQAQKDAAISSAGGGAKQPRPQEESMFFKNIKVFDGNFKGAHQ